MERKLDPAKLPLVARCPSAASGALATGVHAQLAAAHVGDRGATASAVETQDAALAARIEVAVHTGADRDRRLNQGDTPIEEAAKRGQTNAALSALEAPPKAP